MNFLSRALMVFIAAQAEPPDAFVENIDAIPDLTQTAVLDDALGDGESLCAPVAVSNSFVFLAERGYPKLLPNAGSRAAAQIEIVKTLASSDYMNSGVQTGTSKQGILSGVGKYVSVRGYEIKQIEYRGLEIHYKPGERSPSVPVDTNWLKTSVGSNASVWLQVGWYLVQNTTTYKRVGGHWVTLTGYETDVAADVHSLTLVVHDPSPRSGDTPNNERLRLKPILAGQILGFGLPQPAEGFHDIGEGSRLPSNADTAILEGAIVMELIK